MSEYSIYAINFPGGNTLRRYNWKRSLPKRGIKWKTYALPEGSSVIDLRPQCPPIVDQGQIGSCTGNAIAGAYGFLELQELAKKNGPEQFNDGTFDPVSRLFIYWNERSLEGDTHQDAGATVSDGIQTLKQWGACRESTWPYDANLLFQSPSRRSYGEAYNHKAIFDYGIDHTNISNILGCLNEGYPVVFGCTLYESFESQVVADTGQVPMPGEFEAVLGGHCMLIVGANAQTQQFIVRNSWGTSWGDQGYCYFPFQYLTDPSLAADFWTLRRTAE